MKASESTMVNANDFHRRSDSETLEAALKHKGPDGMVVIPPRASQVEPERDFWVLDRAVLIPENTTVILQNCTVKLSDNCRDNFFRTANCGLGIEDPQPIFNVHLRGEGLCTLLGADHPRSTGDSSKALACPCPYEPEDLCRMADWVPEERRTPQTLDFWDQHSHTYGTDYGKEDQSQYGDWRNIGVLFANARNFSVENLRIVDSHSWAISLEACSYGTVRKIEFDACMSRVIDGLRHNIENQDGLNLRNGCHHIMVSDITGSTGDDVIALTAIADPGYVPGGSINYHHVMHNDWCRRERDIHDVTIRNVIARSNLCAMVRLLAMGGASVHRVVIDGVIDAEDAHLDHGVGILVGVDHDGYGKTFPEAIRNIAISNVICNGYYAIAVKGYLRDSVISNVISHNPKEPVLKVMRPDGVNHVQVRNMINS